MINHIEQTEQDDYDEEPASFSLSLSWRRLFSLRKATLAPCPSEAKMPNSYIYINKM
jgi:hypothetical protein